MAEALRLPFYCSMLTSFVTSSALRTHNCQLGALPLGPNSCTHKLYPFSRSHSLAFRHKNTKSVSFELNATVTETEQPKWWEKNAPNMFDIHSTEEFLKALSEAGDRLVIVEFYGTWCASCRALFPKLCKTAVEHPDILFLKVNFDENKPMCKSMNVKVLPYFHFYRGADGRLESFSCSLAKFQKIKDAIETHNTARCSIGPPMPIDLKVESSIVPKVGPVDRAQS